MNEEQDSIPMTGGDTTDVDALLSSIEQPNSREIPMKAETTPSPQPQQTQNPSELEFTWKDKQIKVPYADGRVKQWASQGYDYAQRMAEFNQREQQYAQKEQTMKQLEETYGPVDKYVRENPEWWNHVVQQYQQREQQMQQDQNHPLYGELNQLKSKLQPLEEFVQNSVQKEERQQRDKEDASLTADIKSIRDSYKNIDFDSPDEMGKSLEYKVLEHAHQNGIRNFKTAFKDFYHDQLMKNAEERGKEHVQKDIQKKTKLGLLGTSSAPKKELGQVQNVKNKSYNDIEKEILAELGIR